MMSRTVVATSPSSANTRRAASRRIWRVRCFVISRLPLGLVSAGGIGWMYCCSIPASLAIRDDASIFAEIAGGYGLLQAGSDSLSKTGISVPHQERENIAFHSGDEARPLEYERGVELNERSARPDFRVGIGAGAHAADTNEHQLLANKCAQLFQDLRGFVK